MTTDIEALIREARHSTPTSVVPSSYTSLILRLADALESEHARAEAAEAEVSAAHVDLAREMRARDDLQARIDEALTALGGPQRMSDGHMSYVVTDDAEIRRILSTPTEKEEDHAN